VSNSLCELPAVTAAGCCDPPASIAAAPVRPDNPPGRTTLMYRIGTFSSFRRAMLDELGRLLPTWRENPGARDYGMTLLELWAYIADVLTFYQERIANEAYLPTAIQRASLGRLAELVDYHPAPGAAAGGLLAFTLAKGKVVDIPARLRVASKPAAGKPAATFETDAAITARAEHSAIPLAPLQVVNQFGPLPAPQGPALGLMTIIDDGGPLLPVGQEVRKVTFAGLGLRLRPGDFLLIVDTDKQTNLDTRLLRQVVAVDTDSRTKTTSVSWLENRHQVYPNAGPQVYALRVRAGAFGSGAPAYASLSPALTQPPPAPSSPLPGWFNPATSAVAANVASPLLEVQGGQSQPSLLADATRLTGSSSSSPPSPPPPFPDNWDDPQDHLYWLPAEASVDLDRVYQDIPIPSVLAQSWAVAQDGRTYQVEEVISASPVSASAFTLRARVTQLQLKDHLKAGTFGLRSAVIHTHSEPLTLYDLKPANLTVAGSKLVLDRAYPNLFAGQQVVVRGVLAIPSNIGAPPPPGVDLVAEDGFIESINGELLTLRAPLAGTYLSATVRVLANAVPGSHGETVRDEVLGSGDGSPWQAFALRKLPLTFSPSIRSQGGSAVQSSLQVMVNDVRWQERPNLLDALPGDRTYTAAADDTGRTVVGFGDGVNGARVTTGRNNVHASYRWGQGSGGNVAAGAIVTLVDSLPGLQAVTNPEPTAGGADRESADQIRVNAPASIRTFGRAVSLDDYTSLALGFPGVSRARAAWVRVDSSGKPVKPAIQVTIATSNDIPLAQQSTFARRLRDFLDASRDPNIPLRLLDYNPVGVYCRAKVVVAADHGRKATNRAAVAALSPTPNPDGSVGFFAALGFGESVYLSAVYAALAQVEGVAEALILELRPTTNPLGMALADSIPVPATGLARATVVFDLPEGGFSD
jgi:predicted phage baseplate assembly protein